MADIWVSKHAMRRYIERVKGFSISAVITDDSEALRVYELAGVDLRATHGEIQAILGGAADAGATSIKSGGMRYILGGRALMSVVPLKRGGFGGV